MIGDWKRGGEVGNVMLIRWGNRLGGCMRGDE